VYNFLTKLGQQEKKAMGGDGGFFCSQENFYKKWVGEYSFFEILKNVS